MTIDVPAAAGMPQAAFRVARRRLVVLLAIGLHGGELVAERRGYDLLPEMGYKPVNKYLPPRKRQPAGKTQSQPGASLESGGKTVMDGFFRWADRLLSR